MLELTEPARDRTVLPAVKPFVMFLALVLVGVGALAALFLRPGGKGDVALPRAERGVRAQEQGAPELVQPAEAPSAAVEGPQVPIEEQAAPVAALAGVPDEEAFAREHAGSDLETLRVAKLAVAAELAKTKKEVFDARFARGDYDEEQVAHGEEHQVHASYPDGTERLLEARYITNGGGTLVRVAHMRPQDQPKVHALWLEERWLGRRIRELEQQQSSK